MLRYAVGCATQVSWHISLRIHSLIEGETLGSCMTELLHLHSVPEYRAQDACLRHESESGILYARRLVLDRLMLSSFFGKSCRDPWSNGMLGMEV